MEASNLDYSFTTGGEYELQCAIELYGQSLLRYCHNILCDYFEAQDVVQMTFIKAYDKRKTFKKGTSLSAWLYRIAYTTCIDYLRKKKIFFFFPRSNMDSENMKFEANTDATFINDDLKTALLTLSPKERALIFSRVIDEKSYTELEAIYNVSAVTLRKRYERAKTKLANILRETNSYYERLEEIK
ncbi:RNA polymerase sigma factor, sigma-70 family [Gottschalkia purinilytica]|uniref:RNA polymerase sigma factor n=1 Tax=Gottschalkia purinilytica TaxID=1503 RepID=A0A0L0WC69_GOTPU|nr:sigma-70 family RNA polymerase sigma factor [Gottschalkia purinilytica]KNF09062.1 RNA polymerase sigma factor, sigma-70 family [Gottschalkia purinilytica]